MYVRSCAIKNYLSTLLLHIDDEEMPPVILPAGATELGPRVKRMGESMLKFVKVFYKVHRDRCTCILSNQAKIIMLKNGAAAIERVKELTKEFDKYQKKITQAESELFEIECEISKAENIAKKKSPGGMLSSKVAAEFEGRLKTAKKAVESSKAAYMKQTDLVNQNKGLARMWFQAHLHITRGGLLPTTMSQQSLRSYERSIAVLSEVGIGNGNVIAEDQEECGICFEHIDNDMFRSPCWNGPTYHKLCFYSFMKVAKRCICPSLACYKKQKGALAAWITAFNEQQVSGGQ